MFLSHAFAFVIVIRNNLGFAKSANKVSFASVYAF